MALVTFMSDFGNEDHYVAAVKAAMLRTNPALTIIDISHHIFPSDIGHASYVLKQVFKEFPEGSVHICAVDSSGREPSRQVAIKLEDHYFVGSDCGILSLLSDQKPASIVILKGEKESPSTFEAKETLAPAAAKLAAGADINSLGPSAEALKALYSRQLKVTKREIAGNIIRVDSYGNLITNISKEAFETIMKINGNKPFQIGFGRELCDQFNQSYNEVESGDYFVLFNSNQLLQIGIKNGRANELLGLSFDAPVSIKFEV